MRIMECFARARKQMSVMGVDCLILSASTDLAYMTGFCGIAMERPIFLMLNQTDAYFVAPEFEVSSLSKEIQRNTICVGWKENEDPYLMIRKYVGEKPQCAAVGNQMSAEMFYRFQNTFVGWRWRMADSILGLLRRQKTEEEYQCLKRAQVLAGKAFLRMLADGLCGKTEYEVAESLNTFMQEEGLEIEGLPLVATGKNSAEVHHKAGQELIRNGDVVVIDFCGKVEGYYSDITRTVVVKEAPQGFNEVYQVVRRANEAALAAAKPGITGDELDRVAREVIDKAGYGAYFTHRLGHGIGRDIHESPYIVNGNLEALQEGNVFSNEPGIYLPGRFGIRLEDVLFLRDGYAECLTELPHEYMVVDKGD